MTDNLTLHPKTDTATPDITNVTDTPDATPKPLTEDRLQHYNRCKRQIPSVSTSPNAYQMAGYQNMMLISSCM